MSLYIPQSGIIHKSHVRFGIKKGDIEHPHQGCHFLVIKTTSIIDKCAEKC